MASDAFWKNQFRRTVEVSVETPTLTDGTRCLRLPYLEVASTVLCSMSTNAPPGGCMSNWWFWTCGPTTLYRAA